VTSSNICRKPPPRPRRSLAASLAVLAAVLLGDMVVSPAAAQEASQAETPVQARAAPDEPIVVAVRDVPPFSMRDSAGNWEGLSVDLWQDVADVLNLEFEWREAALEETIDLLVDGSVDVAVTALSVTQARERRVDFSHPYYVSGLAPAFRTTSSQAWLTTIRGFFSWEFLSAIGSLAVVLLAAGFAIWLFERKANAEEFGEGNVRRGLGDGFWWSAVTMTTVGYGDKSPKTLGGRVVALIWMFVSLIIIASFTASIAASLTTNQLREDAFRDKPISELTVGVLEGSAALQYAASQGAQVEPFMSIREALEALQQEQVDTVVHDAPILRFEVREAGLDLEVANQILVRDDYAFALAENSPLRNDVNLAMLSILREPVWQDIRSRYLGASESALE
jgi:polar amino acid transport system substrate-binding protein